jgi:cytosine/creatinine deaminase
LNRRRRMADILNFGASITHMPHHTKDPFMEAAVDEARRGFEEGGIPIGSVLVCDGRILARGRNRRVQDGSVIHHAEMNCLENAGRLPASAYRRCTIYSTLSPCHMCSGAILLYGIGKCVIGENRTFMGPEDLLRAKGVAVEVRDNGECLELMTAFTKRYPDIWNEDIGV